MRELIRAQKAKAIYTRNHSYKNHILLLKNNFSLRFGLLMLLKVILFEMMKALYMLLLHPKTFFGGMKNLLFVPGRSSKRQVSPNEMLSYFK